MGKRFGKFNCEGAIKQALVNTLMKLVEVKVIIRDEIWEVVSCYYPHVGRSTLEKEEFYEILERVVVKDKVLIGGDFNVHFGIEPFGFCEIHWGLDIGQWNDGGVWMLDWAVGKGI